MYIRSEVKGQTKYFVTQELGLSLKSIVQFLDKTCLAMVLKAHSYVNSSILGSVPPIRIIQRENVMQAFGSFVMEIP